MYYRYNCNQDGTIKIKEYVCWTTLLDDFDYDKWNGSRFCLLGFLLVMSLVNKYYKVNESNWTCSEKLTSKLRTGHLLGVVSVKLPFV